MAGEEENVSVTDHTKDGSTKDNESKQSGFENFDPSSLNYVDGKCFYKDPSSGTEYEWNEEKHQWEPKAPSEKDYTFEDGTYFYTDKNTKVRYKWDKEKNEWALGEAKISLIVSKKDNDEEVDSDEEEVTEKKVVRQDMSKGTYGTDGETLTYTDVADGTVYLWDKQKSAWFPKVDDDFLAQYQLSYGFTKPDNEKSDNINNSELTEKEKPTALSVEEESLKRKAQEPAWFDVSDETNNKVYVSNLPTDISETEFVDLMQKCGLVMKDPDTGKMKIKLYTDPKTDVLKGDALCTYIKVESVGLALTVLDGYEYRGKKLHVERAKFTMKGSAYDPSLKPKKKKRKDKDKLKKMQEKLFDWRPEKITGERAKHEKVVVIKNLFDPSIFDKDVGLILEYQEDLREECRKCGDVRKVVIFDRHPEGAAQVFFKEFEGAEACVQLLEGRWFGQRKISAEIWDGKTKFKIAETEAEMEQRLQKWDSFLEAEKEEKARKNEEDKQKKLIDDADISTVKTESEKDRDSDGTRSSAGSGDETDEDNRS